VLESAPKERREPVKMDRKSQIKECLERVNEFRSIHDVVPLTINEKLNTEAQDWAKHLAEKDGLEHSPKDSRKNGKGENLFGFTGDQQIVTAFDKWYAEEDEYDYKKNKYVSSAGNFTQLVWAGYGHLTVVAFVTSQSVEHIQMP